jgi:WD40 repeat protein
MLRWEARSEVETVRLWPVGSGKEIPVLKGHGEKPPAIACSPDGMRIAFASKGAVIIKALVRKAD